MISKYTIRNSPNLLALLKLIFSDRSTVFYNDSQKYNDFKKVHNPYYYIIV